MTEQMNERNSIQINIQYRRVSKHHYNRRPRTKKIGLKKNQNQAIIISIIYKTFNIFGASIRFPLLR